MSRHTEPPQFVHLWKENAEKAFGDFYIGKTTEGDYLWPPYQKGMEEKYDDPLADFMYRIYRASKDLDTPYQEYWNSVSKEAGAGEAGWKETVAKSNEAYGIHEIEQSLYPQYFDEGSELKRAFEALTKEDKALYKSAIDLMVAELENGKKSDLIKSNPTFEATEFEDFISLYSNVFQAINLGRNKEPGKYLEHVDLPPHSACAPCGDKKAVETIQDRLEIEPLNFVNAKDVMQDILDKHTTKEWAYSSWGRLSAAELHSAVEALRDIFGQVDITLTNNPGTDDDVITMGEYSAPVKFANDKINNADIPAIRS